MILYKDHMCIRYVQVAIIHVMSGAVSISRRGQLMEFHIREFTPSETVLRPPEKVLRWTADPLLHAGRPDFLLSGTVSTTFK